MPYSWLDMKMLVRSLFSDPFEVSEERELLVDGVRILVRRRSSDRFVVHEVFKRKVYGEPPQGVVVDLGANIGSFSLYTARNATQVFAFEPESSNFEQLQKNIKLNHTLPIQIFKKAAGGQSGFDVY
jgi:predicted RNA methylase